MSADDTLSLIAQPLYYGPEAYGAVPKGSLSAEHFLLRVAELQLKFGWTEKKMLDMALSYMRGPARDYFNHQVKMTLGKTDLRNVLTSWPHFQRHFKETFFVLRNKRDIAFGWSALTQTGSERSDEFFNRVCRAVNEAMEIMPYPPAPEMTLPQELVDVCTAKKTVRDQTLQLINAYFKDAIAMADDRWRQTWVIGTVQRGLRDPQLKKMIDKEQQKDSDLRTISLLLIHAESQRTTAPKNVDAPGGKSRSGSNKGGVNDVHAMKADGQKKKTNPGGQKRDMSNVRCYNCQQFGHISKWCKNPAVAGVQDGNSNAGGAGPNQPEPGNASAMGVNLDNPAMAHLFP